MIDNLGDLFKKTMKSKNLNSYPKTFALEFKSHSTALLLTHMIQHWLNYDRKPFYKFKQHCKHQLYKEGDSWCEELRFTRHGFDEALDSIATKINKGCKNTKEIKENSLITYYTDKNRVTWYEVNEEKVCEFFIFLIEKNAKSEDGFTYAKSEKGFSEVKSQNGFSAKSQNGFSAKSQNGFTFFNNKKKTTRNDIHLFNKNKFLLKSPSAKSEGKNAKEKLNINIKEKEKEKPPIVPLFDKQISVCSKSSHFSLPFSGEKKDEMENRKSLDEIVSDLSKPKEIDFLVYDKKLLTPTKLNSFMNMTFNSLGHTDQIYEVMDKKVAAALKKMISSLKQHEHMTNSQIVEFIYRVITEWDTLRKHPRLSSNTSRARLYKPNPNFWEIYQLHRELIYALNNPVTIDKSKVLDFVSVDLETFKREVNSK